MGLALGRSNNNGRRLRPIVGSAGPRGRDRRGRLAGHLDVIPVPVRQAARIKPARGSLFALIRSRRTP